MTASPPVSQLARSTTLHVAFGFLAMGGWAAFVNREHGAGVAALAFAVQGTLSGLLTLVLKKGLEWGFRRLQGPSARLIPPIVSCLSIATVLVTAHTLASTPEVLATVALPWTVSTLYGFVYSFTLPEKDVA